MRYKIINTFALCVMMKKIAESMKQPVTFNRLSNIISATGTKIGTSTVINYIEYAKGSRILFGIQNIAAKLADKESTQKYYFADNGLLSLFLQGPETALLENMTAIELIRRYGRDDNVFYYKKNIEVDFYIPDQQLAVQACYSLTESETEKREISALIKLSEVLPCRTLLIITRDTETQISKNNRTIQLLPIWKRIL